MQRLEIESPTQSRVTAVFETSALSFELPPAATLGDLAKCLAQLRHRYGGTLISVAVKFLRENEQRRITAGRS